MVSEEPQRPQEPLARPAPLRVRGWLRCPAHLRATTPHARGLRAPLSSAPRRPGTQSPRRGQLEWPGRVPAGGSHPLADFRGARQAVEDSPRRLARPHCAPRPAASLGGPDAAAAPDAGTGGARGSQQPGQSPGKGAAARCSPLTWGPHAARRARVPSPPSPARADLRTARKPRSGRWPGGSWAWPLREGRPRGRGGLRHRRLRALIGCAAVRGTASLPARSARSALSSS